MQTTCQSLMSCHKGISISLLYSLLICVVESWHYYKCFRHVDYSENIGFKENVGIIIIIIIKFVCLVMCYANYIVLFCPKFLAFPQISYENWGLNGNIIVFPFLIFVCWSEDFAHQIDHSVLFKWHFWVSFQPMSQKVCDIICFGIYFNKIQPYTDDV
jgi:hypothetical protein